MAQVDKQASEQEARQARLVSFWNHKFKEAYVTKAPYMKRWNEYWDAYNGDYFKGKNLPDYKSDLVSNYIFSTIETIRPIMLDNDPQFQSMPRQPEGTAFSSDLNEALMYEWDREGMTTKLYRELITTLVTGTSVYFLPWDGQEKQVKAIPVNPFNIFPDPLATCVEDAEYIIYASYKNESRMKRLFPKHADKLDGADVNYSELVYNNNRNASVSNQILVLEVWTRDHETIETDASNGEKKLRYPNGRVLTLAPELGILLSDKAMPYQDKQFPFVLMKDYDVPGKFWGEGEVAQLMSPQKYMNELNNAILDNAKATANMPWIVDKNSGIAPNSITSRPGLVLRKNPGTEVKRDQPPGLPAYVVNAMETYKSDMEQISGIFDSLKGNSATGVYTAQGILALQEAGQARIRLKVKIMEEALGKIGRIWYSRMQQFWKDDKWLRMTKMDGSYDFKRLQSKALEMEYDIQIMAGSTMAKNRGAMLDLMIRLAQTQMPDGQMLVDREAVVQYLPEEIKASLIERMQGGQQAVEAQIQELQQQLEETMQALQQITEESTSNDEQTMEVVEELMGAVEEINKEIVQLKHDNDTIKSEEARQEELDQIRNDSYNSGFRDAEGLSTNMEPSMGEDALEEGLGEGMPDGELGDLGEDPDMNLGLPDDLLAGIEDMTDDELELLLQSNPELADLLQ